MSQIEAIDKLLEFLDQYSEATCKQIESIRSQFSELSEGIAEGIMLINQHLCDTKDKANSVISHRSGEELKAQLENIENRFRRSGGKYTKYMESLTEIDGKMGPVLLSMMAAMSMSDVLSQRIEHIVTATKGAHVGLSEILVDFEKRCNHPKVKAFKDDLLDLNRSVFSTEVEREILENIFSSKDKAADS